jgi:ABC-2 type transport system ATP-binding protein
MDAVTVENVRKNFGKREILRGISFSVREGEVFGFLGKNGAGKSTTIKMMAGLITPDGGCIRISGHDVRGDFVRAMERTGVVVENPEFYPNLTGRENLACFARMYGGAAPERR